MSDLITRSTSVRTIVSEYPGSEEIFEQHGLSGCGGPNGPMEPVGFFAAIHHVDAETLIRELNEYVGSRNEAEAAEAAAASRMASRHTYAYFLTASLLLAIVVGTTTGMLAAISGGGWVGPGGEAWSALVQAHGHGQMFGFLGLFIMGMAYHTLPRFKALPPIDRRVVLASFVLMAGGVVARLVAQPHGQGAALWLMGASAASELAAALLFSGSMLALLLRARDRREPFDRFLMAALCWFAVLGAMNAFLVFEAVGSGERVLNRAGDAALLEAGIQGFVLLFVLGVSFRVLPFFMRLKAAHPRVRDAAFGALLIAVPLRVGAMWAPAFGDAGWAEPAVYAATFAIAAAVLAAVIALRVFEPAASDAPVSTEGPPAFAAMVRTAFAWLLVGTALDVYWRLRELGGGFTPYYAGGAIRHAMLLGFATTMILAMAYRTVPVFSGRALRWRAAVPASFALVLAAAILRVFPVALTTQPSDLDFGLMATGGVALLIGLSIFAVELGSSVYGWWALPDGAAAEEAGVPAESATEAPATSNASEAAEPDAPAAQANETGGWISADMTVADALAVDPAVLDTLIALGFQPLADAEARQRLAPTITIGRAAAVVSADPEALVEMLNLTVSAIRLPPPDGSPAEIYFKLDDTDANRGLILTALKSCYDPEIPVDIVDLGLVHGVVVHGHDARVTMTLTSPFCPAGALVAGEVEEALGSVPDIDSVDVDIVYDRPWKPERMSAAARSALGWE